jgi:hypothetical protein
MFIHCPRRAEKERGSSTNHEGRNATQPQPKQYFTTETPSSQRSEYFLIKNSLLCGPPRLRGEFSSQMTLTAEYFRFSAKVQLDKRRRECSELR